MWPFGMTRQEVRDLLRENSDELIEILLDAYGMTVDEIVIHHMYEAVEACGYGEAC